MGDTRATVLVVEDDADIRQLICEALATEGLTTVEAGDGEARAWLGLLDVVRQYRGVRPWGC